MVLWWIGNAVLLVAVLPVVIFLLNRILAALERIRAASDSILAGGVALVGELRVRAGRTGEDRRDDQCRIDRRGQVRRLGREIARLNCSAKRKEPESCLQLPGAR